MRVVSFVRNIAGFSTRDKPVRFLIEVLTPDQKLSNTGQFQQICRNDPSYFLTPPATRWNLRGQGCVRFEVFYTIESGFYTRFPDNFSSKRPCGHRWAFKSFWAWENVVCNSCSHFVMKLVTLQWSQVSIEYDRDSACLIGVAVTQSVLKGMRVQKL